MQVYKAFFKIISKNITEILIYAGVFLILSVLFAGSASDIANTDFEEVKVNIQIINDDTESVLVEGFKEYLSNHTNIKDVGVEKEDIQDALFFKEIDYLITIPNGFTESLLKGDKIIDIEKTIVPGLTSEFYMDSLINKYINTVESYRKTINDISEEELVKYVSEDLKKDTEVSISLQDNLGNDELRNNYYNYLAYAMISILTLGLSIVIKTFNKKEMKMRNLSTSLSMKSLNFQLILGTITFAILVWIFMTAPSFILYKESMFNINGLLYMLSSFVFTIAAVSISLLAANLVKNRSSISSVANVLALGSSFISGVFVPQEFLNETVISIAKFNPTYWYVKANDEISILTNYSFENLKPIFISLLIVLGFSIAIVLIALVIIKQNRLKYSYSGK